MRDNGIQISEPSEALMKRLKSVGDSMTAEWLKRAGADGEKLLKAYQAK